MEPLNSSGWSIPNGLGYLDNPGPVPLSQLTDGQFRPSTGRRSEFVLQESSPSEGTLDCFAGVIKKQQAVELLCGESPK
jgi:hypothetical protein